MLRSRREPRPRGVGVLTRAILGETDAHGDQPPDPKRGRGRSADDGRSRNSSIGPIFGKRWGRVERSGLGATIAPGTRNACVSDADCAGADHRCVAMEYKAKRFPDAQTGFCLRIATALPEGSATAYDCAPPYVTVLIEALSLSGGNLDDYCGLREDLTNCPAVRAHQEAWDCANRGDVACPDGGF